MTALTSAAAVAATGAEHARELLRIMRDGFASAPPQGGVAVGPPDDGVTVGPPDDGVTVGPPDDGVTGRRTRDGLAPDGFAGGPARGGR
ncbi:hypothetical protein ACIBKY_25800 [Nonomuraea sp. NPDC050394]|uniref:hypothetical protein n=1 Tax=Nonomuraea sp. NPDC050394 TaxID=3364363 RepID=UPI0037B186EA